MKKIALFAAGLLASTGIARAQFLPLNGLSSKTVIHAPGIPLDGQTLSDMAAQVNANATNVANAQTTANAAIPMTEKNTASGVAGLDGSGNVTASTVAVAALSGTDVTVAPTDTDTALYTLSPSAPTTVTLGANGSAGHQKMVELLITQPTSGGFAVTLAGTIFWPNGISPVISAVADDKTLIRFITTDGGKTYIGGF